MKLRDSMFAHADKESVHLGSMLVEEAPAERMRLVKLVWQRLQQMDCGMNILHYNALLRVFNSNHHNFTPANFLESLHDAGLDPDA